MSPNREPSPHWSVSPTNNPRWRHRKEVEAPHLHIEKILQEQSFSNYAQEDLSIVTLKPLLAVLKKNRIIHKHTYANYSSFHLKVFLGLSNPQGQRQTSTISVPCDNFGERKAMFNLETNRRTQMQLNKCIHVA
jgi:hypothetical protein